MLVGLLLYLFMGFLAVLLPEYLITAEDIASGNPFVALSVLGIVALLAIWTLVAAWWLFTVAQNESRNGPLSRSESWTIAVGLATLAVTAAWVKPVLTWDPAYYVAYGRQIVEYGLSPYKVNLWVSADDVVISQLDKMWFHNIAFYGPLALSLYTLANLLVAQPTLYALTTAVKMLWLPFYAGLGFFVYAYNQGRRYRFTLLLAVLANPLMLWLCLVDGHVDLLVMVFLLATAYYVQRDRLALAVLGLSAAASIKIVGIVAFPVALCCFLRRSMARGLQFAGAFALLYGGLYALVGGGEYLAVIEFTNQWDNLVAGSTVPRLLQLVGVSDMQVIRTLSNLIFYGTVALVCLATLKGKLGQNAFLPMALTLAALFFTRTYYQPWYTLWFWPLLWYASDCEKYQFRAIALWTVTVLLSWTLAWPNKIWLLTAGAVWCFWSVFRNLKQNPEP